MEPTSAGPESAPQPTQAPTPEAHEALLRQCQRLEKLIIFALVAMIITIVAVNFFLSRDARAAALQAKRMEATFQGYQRIQPYMQDLLSALQTYAGQDKDFQPIWQRYRPVLTNFFPVVNDAPSNSPAATKAPATAPVKPKK